MALAVGDTNREGVRVPFTLSNRSRSAKEVGHPAAPLKRWATGVVCDSPET